MVHSLRCIAGVLMVSSSLGLTAPRARFHATISTGDKKAPAALDEALSLLALERGPEAPTPDLAVLCVGRPLEEDLDMLADACVERTRARLLVAVVGAGVAGGGREAEDAACVSVAAGTLPEGSEAVPLAFARSENGRFDERTLREEARELRKANTSVLVFGDPTSPLRETLAFLDACAPTAAKVGGISCPSSPDAPSIAVRRVGTAVPTPPGAVLAVALRGPGLEVHAVAAQGAVAVGNAYTVTASPAPNVVSGLDDVKPLDRLKALLEANAKNPRVAELLGAALLVGLKQRGEDDFLVRQVLAASADGALVVGDPSVVAGETTLQFHVRDGDAAREDLAKTLARYDLERSFRGGDGAPLLSLVVSCAGRGEALFGEPGVDAAAFYDGVGAPVVGFAANGEVGPVGARVPDGAANVTTHVHGFTATAAVLYDRGAPPPPEGA